MAVVQCVSECATTIGAPICTLAHTATLARRSQANGLVVKRVKEVTHDENLPRQPQVCVLRDYGGTHPATRSDRSIIVLPA
jgi:hypothetical protein